MADEAPKSSYELAMERLRKKDAESGEAPLHLTDAQKAEIAEVRSVYQARLAHVELTYQSTRGLQADQSIADALEDEYRRDRERLTSERDSKIDKIRRGPAS